MALADRIAKKKGGDYNSSAATAHPEGRQDGNAGVTQGRREGDYNINTLDTKAGDKNAVGTAADDGEEGYQVDGVFISTTQANEFAAANRDRFLEITRAARRARRAKDGTVTLIEK